MSTFIPQIAAAVKDLPRWFKLDGILTMREILSYHVGEDGFEQLLQAYPKSRQTRKKRRI